MLLSLDGDDYLGDHRAKQELSVTIGGGRCVKHGLQVSAGVAAPRDLLVGEWFGATRAHGRESLLGLPGVTEALFPLALQGASNEAVLGLAAVELASGALGVILDALEVKLG